jgi:hypothetical protein
MVTVLCAVVGAQPASAAVVVPYKEPGHICGPYVTRGSLKFQACTWASWAPPDSRIWFTGHFANSSNAPIRVNPHVGWWQNGEWHSCGYIIFDVPAHGVAATYSGFCWFTRFTVNVQTTVDYEGGRAMSPTLVVQGG